MESIREIDLHEQVGIGEVGQVTLFRGQAKDIVCGSEITDYLGRGWGGYCAERMLKARV